MHSLSARFIYRHPKSIFDMTYIIYNKHYLTQINIFRFEWVGWNNETLAGAPVEMIFEFDSVRTFVLASFHVNNMFSKRAHAFRAVTLHFSVGGSNYQDDFVEYTNRRDTQNEQARTISINIAGRVGRFVKVKMYLDAMWLMVSEVRFESVANTMDGVFLTYM